MKNSISFYASLYDNGLHGGAVYLDDSGFYFKCQKCTVAQELRRLMIPYIDIKSVYANRKIVLPLTVIETVYGRTYRFLIFRRKKFIEFIEKMLIDNIKR